MLTCKDPFISSKAVSSLHQINKTTKTNDICFTKVLFFEQILQPKKYNIVYKGRMGKNSEMLDI